MTDTPPRSPGLADDVVAVETGSTPGQWTAGPVRYVVVSDHEQVLGALWVARRGGAAGFVRAARARGAGEDESAFWRSTITAAQGSPEWSAPGFLDYWRGTTLAGRYLSDPVDAAGLPEVRAAVGGA